MNTAVDHQAGQATRPWLASSPVQATTVTVDRPVDPRSCDCVVIIAVRAGAATIVSELGECDIAAGDVVLLAPNTTCGGRPRPRLEATVIRLDKDYVSDLIFWQHAAVMVNRWQAREILQPPYVIPAQIIRLAREQQGTAGPWLDRLVQVSQARRGPGDFCALQAALFGFFEVIAAGVEVARIDDSPVDRSAMRARMSQRGPTPVRREAALAAELMRADPARRWTRAVLADEVHLSPSRLATIFVDAFGKTPAGYLGMVRAEVMAGLLRDRRVTVQAAARQVGWSSRCRAAVVFRQHIGTTPSRYRRLCADTALGGIEPDVTDLGPDLTTDH